MRAYLSASSLLWKKYYTKCMWLYCTIHTWRFLWNFTNIKHTHSLDWIPIVERQGWSTYKTVQVQRAFTSRCTLYVTAVPGARPKTTAITLRGTHRLSHWDTQKRWVEQRSPMCMCVCCVYVGASHSSLCNFVNEERLWWERRRREIKHREKSGRKRETEQLGTHRSDIGPYLAPSSNLHKICGMGLREQREGKTDSTYKKVTIEIIWG